MTTIVIAARINDEGQIELDKPLDLPPGEINLIVETVDADAEAADEARWQASFAASGGLLARMAQKAREEFHAGQTVELDPDELERDDTP